MKNHPARGIVPRISAGAAVVAATTLVLTGCLDDGPSPAKEIDSLKENIDNLHRDFDAQRERTREVERELGEMRQQHREAENAKNLAENKLAAAERELERVRESIERERSRPPTATEQLEAAKGTVRESLASIVSIEGDQVSGRGAIITAGESRHVYLPASLLAANSRIVVVGPGGERLSDFESFEIASTGDLARLPLDGDEPAGLAVGAGTALESGDRVFGMAPGGELVDGRVYQATEGGVTADQALAAGGPGSPVFHGQTGALAGFIRGLNEGPRDLWRDAAEAAQHHRQTLIQQLQDGVDWLEMPLARFLEEGKLMTDFDEITRLVHAFAAIRPSPDGIPFDSSPPGATISSRDIMAKHGDQQTVRDLVEFGKQIEQRRMRLSDSDMKRRAGSIYSQLEAASKRQKTTFEARRFSPYHEAAARQSLEWRTQAEAALATTIAGIAG